MTLKEIFQQYIILKHWNTVPKTGPFYRMLTNSPGLGGWGRMPQPNLPFDLFTVLSKGALLPQVPTGG